MVRNIQEKEEIIVLLLKIQNYLMIRLIKWIYQSIKQIFWSIRFLFEDSSYKSMGLRDYLSIKL